MRARSAISPAEGRPYVATIPCDLAWRVGGAITPTTGDTTESRPADRIDAVYRDEVVTYEDAKNAPVAASTDDASAGAERLLRRLARQR